MICERIRISFTNSSFCLSSNHFRLLYSNGHISFQSSPIYRAKASAPKDQILVKIICCLLHLFFSKYLEWSPLCRTFQLDFFSYNNKPPFCWKSLSSLASFLFSFFMYIQKLRMSKKTIPLPVPADTRKCVNLNDKRNNFSHHSQLGFMASNLAHSFFWVWTKWNG